MRTRSSRQPEIWKWWYVVLLFSALIELCLLIYELIATIIWPFLKGVWVGGSASYWHANFNGVGYIFFPLLFGLTLLCLLFLGLFYLKKRSIYLLLTGVGLVLISGLSIAQLFVTIAITADHQRWMEIGLISPAFSWAGSTCMILFIVSAVISFGAAIVGFVFLIRGKARS